MHGPSPRPARRHRNSMNGYLLTVDCSCGVVFERGVALEDAERDLVMLALEESIPAPEIGVGQWGRLAVMNNDAPGRV